MCRLCRIYPRSPLTIDPLSLSFCLFFEIKPYARSILNIISPLPYILVTIRKQLGAFTLHLAILKVTFESRLVGPYHHTFAVHIVILKFSFVQFARICEVILSEAMELTIEKFAFIVSTLKLESTCSRLFAFLEVAHIFDLVVVPAFCAVTILEIFFPFALVHGAISIDENSVTICFSILPFSLVDVSISMSHSSLAVK